MHILALDTSLAACSVAIVKVEPGQRGDILASTGEAMPRGHAARLAPLVDECLTGSGFDWPDLDRLACTVGPGGFTGVRIGLSLARGLSLTTGLPLAGITSLDALLMAAALDAERRTEKAGSGEHTSDREKPLFMATIDSRRQDLFVRIASLRNDEIVSGEETTRGIDSLPPLRMLCDAQAVPREDLVSFARSLRTGSEHMILIGDGAETARQILEDAGLQVRISPASPLPEASLVASLAAMALAGPGETVKPLYLRPPDVSPPDADRGKGIARRAGFA